MRLFVDTNVFIATVTDEAETGAVAADLLDVTTSYSPQQ
jgi:predicted nucleic acid-binding protein